MSATIIISHYIKMTYAEERNGDAAFPVPPPPVAWEDSKVMPTRKCKNPPPLMDARHLQIIEI